MSWIRKHWFVSIYLAAFVVFVGWRLNYEPPPRPPVPADVERSMREFAGVYLSFLGCAGEYPVQSDRAGRYLNLTFRLTDIANAVGAPYSTRFSEFFAKVAVERAMSGVDRPEPDCSDAAIDGLEAYVALAESRFSSVAPGIAALQSLPPAGHNKPVAD